MMGPKLTPGLAVLAVLAALVGFLLTGGRPSPSGGATTAEPRDPDVSLRTVRRLEAEQQALKEELTKLQRAVQGYQALAAARSTSLEEIAREVERQRLVAGMVPLKGAGVRILLDDSPRSPPSGTDLSNYLVHDYQLRDVVSVLWQAGAEAMSINGERIVGSTAISGMGNAILVNGVRLTPPFDILALGDANALYPLLTSQGTLYQLKTKVNRYGLVWRVEKAGELTVPAYKGPLSLRYATLSSQ